MNYRQIRDLLLEGKPIEEIAIATQISVPEVLNTIPLIYEQLNKEFQEKAANAAAVNFARLETVAQAIMTKIPEAGPRELVSLGNSLAKLIEAQAILEAKIKTQKPQIEMKEQKREVKPEETPKDKKTNFLSQYGDKLGVLPEGDKHLLKQLQQEDEEDADR